MTTCAALIQWVRELIDDYTGEVTEFTPDQFIDACNFAVNNYCIKTTVTYVEKTLPVTIGIVPVGNNLADVFRVKYGAAWLMPSDRDYETSKNASFDAATGVPKRWYPRSDYEIGITPITADSVIVGYQEKPAVLNVENDPVDVRIPDIHHRHLRLAAAAWLLLNDADSQDLSKAQSFMQVFDSLIGVKHDEVDPSKRTVSSRPGG